MSARRRRLRSRVPSRATAGIPVCPARLALWSSPSSAGRGSAPRCGRGWEGGSVTAWIESHTTLREHPKRKRLSRLLGINVRETVGLLHILWWWVLDFAPEGDLSGFSRDEDVADSIDWEGDAYQLMAALEQDGFVDRDRQIHDWDEFAEKWIKARRANADRMKLARARRNGSADSGRPAHVQDTCDARAPQKSEKCGATRQPTKQTTRPHRRREQPDRPTDGKGPPRAPGSGKRKELHERHAYEDLGSLNDSADRTWAATCCKRSPGDYARSRSSAAVPAVGSDCWRRRASWAASGMGGSRPRSATPATRPPSAWRSSRRSAESVEGSW